MVDKVVVVYSGSLKSSSQPKLHSILYLVKSDTVSPPTRHLYNISSGFKAVLPRHYHYQRWSRGHKARGQGQGHKKNRGQGQPFRGQTLSRPRTGMLEAKDTSASALQNHKNFLGDLKKKKKKKGLHKNFSSGLHKKTFSKKFFKRYTKF